MSVSLLTFQEEKYSGFCEKLKKLLYCCKACSQRYKGSCSCNDNVKQMHAVIVLFIGCFLIVCSSFSNC